jgi:hypothetical protein
MSSDMGFQPMEGRLTIIRHKYRREMRVPLGDFEQNISVCVLPKSCQPLKEQRPIWADCLYCDTLTNI